MEALIEKFYSSFANFDTDSMANCYHKNVEFEDPAFSKLYGKEVNQMWEMLIQNQKGKKFTIEYSNIKATESTGSADWNAQYLFSKTGRKVHNFIHAEFEFKDGKIIKHTDYFDLYKWSRMALGTTGYIIGWTPYFKNKLRGQTKSLLRNYQQKQQ